MADHPPVPVPVISESDAETRLSSSHFDVMALLAKADHRFLAGDHRAASSFYRAVVRTVQQNGASSAGMAREAQRAGAMTVWLDQLFKEHLLASLDKAGFTKAHRHPRFQKSLEMMLGERERPPEYHRFPQTPLTYFYPDLPYTQFADPADFEWVNGLESAFSKARQEATTLLEGNADFRPYIKTNTDRPQGDVHGLLENPDWSTLFLWENGGAVEEHVVHCPETFKAVMDHVPLCHIGPRAPSIMLSLLRAGASIPPHTGMINCRYICHLPLIVPAECGFRVGDQMIEWREGEVIMFDDTVQHEAWNRSSQDRIVLIFDIWRPELSEGERQMVNALFAAVDSY